MDNFAGKFFIMAFIADFAHILYSLELMLGSWDMAYGALTNRCRSMNVFLLTHIGVAFGSDTGWLVSC
jgi:hypothetical protein